MLMMLMILMMMLMMMLMKGVMAMVLMEIVVVRLLSGCFAACHPRVACKRTPRACQLVATDEERSGNRRWSHWCPPL